MKQEMRRADRQLAKEEAEELLRKGTYGILSTVCEDGYPYGVPLSYAYEEGKIYFHHTSGDSLMSENILRAPLACFTVVRNTETLPAKFSTKYESVVAFGRVKACEDRKEALLRLVDKYSPGFREKGETYAASSLQRGQVAVYEFEITQMTGKARK